MSGDRADWDAYHRAALERFEVPPLVSRLEPFLPSSGTALDLGSSVGRALPPLLDHGLTVTAVDADERALALLRARFGESAAVDTVHSAFEDLPLGRYDVVVANYSLFFMSPADYEAFWPRLIGAIAPGGVLACVFLGPNDDWHDRGYTIHTREDVDGLLEPLDVLSFLEEDADGETLTGGPKHWHVFHAIARKRA